MTERTPMSSPKERHASHAAIRCERCERLSEQIVDGICSYCRAAISGQDRTENGTEMASAATERLLALGVRVRANSTVSPSALYAWTQEVEVQLKELRQTLAMSDFVEAYEEEYRDWQMLEAIWRENHKDVRIDGEKP